MSIVSKKINGKRGRPPKNPLKVHIDKFELFLSKSMDCNNDRSQEEIMKELQIDKDTLFLFFQHINPDSELRKLVEKKNTPHKKRGRPKGSKNTNIHHVVEQKIVVVPPEVIKFNHNLDSLFQEIDSYS